MKPCGDEDNHQIRLALCGLPAMTDEIVSLVVGEADDIVIVARLRPGPHLQRDFERCGAHLMICAAAAGEVERLWSDIVERVPQPAILNLGDDIGGGELYALKAVRRGLDDLSAQALLATLRDHLRDRSALT